MRQNRRDSQQGLGQLAKQGCFKPIKGLNLRQTSFMGHGPSYLCKDQGQVQILDKFGRYSTSCFSIAGMIFLFEIGWCSFCVHNQGLNLPWRERFGSPIDKFCPPWAIFNLSFRASYKSSTNLAEQITPNCNWGSQLAGIFQFELGWGSLSR